MNGIVLDSDELISLLDRYNVDGFIGVDPDLLPRPAKNERQKMIQRGSDSLTSRGLFTAKGQEMVVDESLDQTLQTIIQPRAIVRVYRESSDQTQFWSWHYFSGPSIVALSFARPNEYRIDTVPDLGAVLKHLQDTLPLEPVPEAVHYKADVPQEDADEIVRMAEHWDVVPTLNILTADGLNMVEAMDLFDDISDFQWHGRIDLMACKDGVVIKQHRVLVIQGQERSWIARQDKPGASTIHIHTYSSGDFERMLGQYWEEIGS